MQKNAKITHFHYNNGIFATKTGDQPLSIFRTQEMPLAELQSDGDRTSALLATDDKNSVLNAQSNS